MKKILLIGHGPQINSASTIVAFPQLRTWSMQRYLQSLGHSVHTIYVDNKEKKLPNADYDVAITAGPFASAYAALSLPDTIPLWLDWPSDPRADLHARLHSTGSLPEPSEQTFVTMLHTLSLRRADAIGVISKRQYWATLSSMIDWRIHDPDIHKKIYTVPIAFDFPFPQTAHNRTEKKNIALAGSINSWFDAQKSFQLLNKIVKELPQINIHIFGGRVSHHITPNCPLQNWHHKQVHHHGWLSNNDFYTSLCKQDIGFWLNHQGVEPLLGSRTRALLFAWMGMDIAASCDTELMQNLCSEKLVWNIRTAEDLSTAMIGRTQHGKKLKEYCRETYSPSAVYAPIGQWLRAPKRYKHPHKDNVSDEIYRLRQTILAIHNSPTWRWGSRLHQLFQNIMGAKK
ncbi:MAG: hypothetical protein CL916_09805 [Deltaproteobacteria bacterium]|nr:hypothetical protein [Deltaproteobacteria bacterium]